jgi:RNA polymerase sigma factor (sigma-70 family)
MQDKYAKELKKALKSRSEETISKVFGFIYESSYSSLFFISKQYSQNEEEAKDIIQSVFETFMNGILAGKEIPDNLFCYLMSMCKFSAIDYYKKANACVSLDSFSPFFENEFSEEESKEDASEYQLMLKGLSKAERYIAVLHIEHSVKIADIATLMDKSRAYVKGTYERASKKIRKNLKEGGLI